MQQILARRERKEKRRKEKKEAAEKQKSSPTTTENAFESVVSTTKKSTEAIGVGASVKIKGLQSVGQVESISGKTAIVIFGDMRTKMSVERLELAEAQKKSKMEQQKESLNAYSISRQTRETIDAHRKNFRQELDVRGMRGDEALNAVTHRYVAQEVQRRLEELAWAFESIPEIERSNENAVASGCDLLIGQVSAFKDTAWGSYEQLEAEGINCLTITGTIVPDETVEDIYTDIRNLGKIFKVEDKAEALIQEMKDDIAATNAVVAGVPEEDKPLVFVFDMYKEDQIYTTAAGLESNLIELAGGINCTRLMADSRWFYTSMETLVAADPDIIVINDYGSQTVEEKIAAIKENPACSDIPAVVNDNFLVIPLVAVMQDIRAPRACRTMAEYFYPDLF